MAQTGVNLINQKGTKVLAYSDTVIFYNGKGNGKIESQDKIDPSSEKAPFGLIKTGNTQPFQVEFDSTNLVVYLNPGMLSVYGRQVQLKEKIKVHDFHQDSLASDNYCTLYIEINLSDILNQTVRIVLTSSANDYEYDYGVNGSNRDNLYKYNNGIYRVPIAQFKFRPMDSNPFSDLKYLIQDFDMSARESVINLSDNSSITGKKVVNEVFTKENINGKASLRFNGIADNKKALEAYENEKSHTKNSAGYSWARQSLGFGGIKINSSLSNLITIERVKLSDIYSGFATKSMNGKRTYCGIDWAHLKKIRLWFTSANFKAKINYQAKEVKSFGGIVYSSADADMSFLYRDYYPRIVDNKIKIALYGSYSTFGWGGMEVDLNIMDQPPDYSTDDTGSWDGYLQTVGAPIAGWAGSTHPFMFMTIEGNYASFKTFGTTKEYSTWLAGLNWAWYIYKDIEITNAAGALYADFIYQGDVNI